VDGYTFNSTDEYAEPGVDFYNGTLEGLDYEGGMNLGQYGQYTVQLSTGNGTFNFSDGVNPGQSVNGKFTMVAAVAPEPSTALLWGSGLLGLILVLRKKSVHESPEFGSGV